ncbi:MAG: deoxyhypusine synthase family protein [Oscillospiraceae bacterium]|nr:deoxyhypusine synthase family protein [Oscillospiraceae bacterium]
MTVIFYDIDLAKLKRYSIKERRNKVCVGQFAPSPRIFGENLVKTTKLLDMMPDILTAKDLKEIVKLVGAANRNERAVIFAMGGHVIKCGLGQIIIDLMRRGILSAVVMNGAASIHDFEIAMIGETSEDVQAVLGEGAFGMAEETGSMHNEAIKAAYETGTGIGYSIGKYIADNHFQYQDHSILYAAYKLGVPAFVAVAIGDDITHMHPEASGAAIGAAAHQDFLSFASILPNCANGGVYFNIGSAVILPEYFLKAFSIVQNLGFEMTGLNTVNMDMQVQYRPATNVVKRPALCGGKGYNLIGAHEIMLPILAHAIVTELRE